MSTIPPDTYKKILQQITQALLGQDPPGNRLDRLKELLYEAAMLTGTKDIKEAALSREPLYQLMAVGLIDNMYYQGEDLRTIVQDADGIYLGTLHVTHDPPDERVNVPEPIDVQ
jgi:hypothetical protein